MSDNTANILEERRDTGAPPHAETAAVDAVPAHAVRIPGTSWNLWRLVAVRAAGFPARIVDDLAAPRASAAADALSEAQASAADLVGPVLRRLAIDIRNGNAVERRPLRELRRRILAGEPASPDDGADACAAADAAVRVAQAGEAYRIAFDAEMDEVHARLETLSRAPRFREAMLWQSAESTRRIWDSLLPGRRPRYRRRALSQVAMRAQRYGVKNDAIGFFGPFGWASVVDDAARIAVTPGPELTSAREVYFEGWSIDTLASCLDAAHPIRPWLAPRIKAGIWIQGARAFRPLRKSYALSEPEVALLALCDGRRTAREQAALLRAGTATTPPLDEPAVFDLLQRLVDADIIAWRLDLAPQVYPEQELRERLARVEDAAIRGACVTALDELLAARAGVAAAAGDPEALDAALASLDACFTRLTDQPSSRRGGQTYAGRTLVYEDCRRDCEVRLGAPLIAELALPLGIVLDGARWISAELGDVLSAHLRVRLAELQAEHGAEIDCHQFLSYVMSMVWMQHGRAPLFDETLARYQQMWEYVLGTPSEQSGTLEVYDAEAVRARATEMFPPRDVAWSLGRYVSPDLLIAAESVEAIRRGDYGMVLGEVHVGNTMGASTYITQHPDPRELFEAAAADTARDKVVIRSFPRPAWIARTNYGLALPEYWRYLFGEDAPCHPPCKELPAGKLVVVDSGSSVIAQARDGSLRFDAVELFGNSLMDEASHMVSEFRPRLPHVPRVRLGNLTLARERWNVVAGDMPFRALAEPRDQFAALRAWGRARGMPRRVFVKCPTERKPWFLDFESPVFAEIFLGVMRQLPDEAPVSLAEMWPDLRHLWLHDREDERFTSELRCVTRAV